MFSFFSSVLSFSLSELEVLSFPYQTLYLMTIQVSAGTEVSTKTLLCCIFRIFCFVQEPAGGGYWFWCFFFHFCKRILPRSRLLVSKVISFRAMGESNSVCRASIRSLSFSFFRKIFLVLSVCLDNVWFFMFGEMMQCQERFQLFKLFVEFFLGWLYLFRLCLLLFQFFSW